MRDNKALVLNMTWLLLGAVLIVFSSMEILNDMYLGFGGGLVGVGVARLVRVFRYKTNDAYKEKVDVEMSDERNRYISMKAWAWAGYSLVLILATVTIVCMILSQTFYMRLASGMVCLIVVLYWISYLILRTKY